MGYIAIAILFLVLGYWLCRERKAEKIDELQGEITYQKIQTEQAYQDGWNEAIRSMQKIARNKLSAGGVKDDREGKAD